VLKSLEQVTREALPDAAALVLARWVSKTFRAAPTMVAFSRHNGSRPASCSKIWTSASHLNKWWIRALAALIATAQCADHPSRQVQVAGDATASMAHVPANRGARHRPFKVGSPDGSLLAPVPIGRCLACGAVLRATGYKLRRLLRAMVPGAEGDLFAPVPARPAGFGLQKENRGHLRYRPTFAFRGVW
jgi:hypothetical protein